MPHAYARSVFLAACIAVIAPFASQAQVLYGSIVGTVIDRTGGVVPNASVTIVNTATGQAKTETSSQDGDYHVADLLPGTYTVSVKAPGFRSFNESNVQVTSNTSPELKPAWNWVR